MVTSPLAARGAISSPLAVGAGGAAALPWWNPDGLTPAATCGAWRAKGAASLAASYLRDGDLGHANIDPAVVGGVAPTFDPLVGWICDGTRWLTTGIAPASTYSMLVQVSGLPGAGTQTPSGSYGGTSSNRYYFRGDGASVRYGYGSTSTLIGAVLVAGNIGLAANNAYRDGLFVGAVAGVWAAGTTAEIYLCAGNPQAAVGWLTGNISAAAIYNVTLTAPQVLARATAMSLL